MTPLSGCTSLDYAVRCRKLPLLLESTSLTRSVGSDLHWYRGHQPSSYNFILGHEVIGEVAEVGSAVKKFKPGDLVLAAFSTSCGEYQLTYDKH